jgi:hypothetical protein
VLSSQWTYTPPSAVNTFRTLAGSAKSPPNQSPKLENSAPVVFVAATTSQNSGSRK